MRSQILALLMLTLCAACYSTLAGRPYTPLDDIQGSLRARIESMTVNEKGQVLKVKGSVSEFSINGKQIELASDQLTAVDGDIFMLTKHYGNVKVVYAGDKIGVFLTPMQIQQFRALQNTQAPQ